MVNRHRKRSLPLLIIREMQIQTPYLSEWLSSKSLQGTNVGEDVKKWETLCPVGGNVSWYSHYGKKVCRVLKKLKIEPQIALLDIYTKKTTALIQKVMLNSNVHSSIIYSNQAWEISNCPSKDEWVKKMQCICMYVYTHTMEYRTQQKKKNEILPFAATWMDLEGILRNKIS